MWTIGYDQVLDQPPSSPSVFTLAEERTRMPSISQPSPIKLQSNTGQMSVDSDAESDEGDNKPSTTTATGQDRLSTQTDRSTDDDLNSPTGSDKFIVVTDVEILEAAKMENNEPQIKSSGYLDLKDGFKWVRRLNYRGKLTMHTAYERKENPSPASVTALGISK